MPSYGFGNEVNPLNKMAAHALACVAILACLSAPALLVAKEKPPQNWDGLELKKVKGLDLVYVRPNTEFPAYKSVQLDPAVVEFAKNWARDQGNSSSSMRRPTASDMQDIKDRLAALMHEVFLKELVDHGYTVVDAPADDTLRVSTAIIDLWINAADTNDPGITRSYTTSAGSMTLVLEARDGPTGQLQARVIDGRSDSTDSYMTWTTRASNTQDAKRIIQVWAKRLRESLDKLNGKTK